MTTTTDRFQVGDRVRCAYGVGTIVPKPESTGTSVYARDEAQSFFTNPDRYAVKVDDLDGGFYGNGVYTVTASGLTLLARPEPTVAEGAEPTVRHEEMVPKADLDAALADVERLRTELTSVRDARSAAVRALDSYKEQVRDALIREGEARGWCDDLDDFLEELDLERRSRDYNVSMTVSIRVPVTVSVTASSDDEAGDLASEDTYQIKDQVTEAIRYDLDSYIQDVDVDDITVAD